MLSTNPSGTALINVSAIFILELELLNAPVIVTKMSFTIFIIVDKNVYPFCIKYFKKAISFYEKICPPRHFILFLPLDSCAFLCKDRSRRAKHRMNAVRKWVGRVQT